MAAVPTIVLMIISLSSCSGLWRDAAAEAMREAPAAVVALWAKCLPVRHGSERWNGRGNGRGNAQLLGAKRFPPAEVWPRQGARLQCAAGPSQATSGGS